MNPHGHKRRRDIQGGNFDGTSHNPSGRGGGGGRGHYSHGGGYSNRDLDGEWDTRKESRFNRSNYRGGHRTAGQYRGASSDVVIQLCKFWATSGNCRKLPHCRFRHDLRLIARVQDAHSRGIYSMCSVTVQPTEDEQKQYALQPGMTLVDLYTASQDKTVKRWTLCPDTTSSSDTSSSPSCPKLQIRHVSTFELGASCLSVFYGQGCLVCGLNDGNVKVFERASGREMTLTGHQSEVHCVQLIENVLVSGDWKGRLILWKPDPVQKDFVIGASLDIGSPITCFIEVVSNSDGTATTNRYLWVGCTGSIKIVDLLSLALVRTIEISPLPNATTPSVVMSLLRLEGYVLCCLLGGGVKVFSSSNGEEVVVNGTKKKHFCSMAGVDSEDGPVVLCGAPQGNAYILSLPSLDEKLHFRHHEQDVRAVLNIGGTPSFFATASMDGALNIWYWFKPALS